MEITSYRSLAAEGKSEAVIKKSRFLGYAAPIESEAQALAFIQDLHKAHPLSSAIAYGYMAGMRQNIQRFSDSGEPSGTAGMPILDVFKQKELTNVVCAVVRYYGGIQLGAGGLTRAFSGTAAQAIAQAGIAVWQLSYKIGLHLDYGIWGSAENYLQHSPFRVLHTDFGQDVYLEVLLRAQEEALFTAKMRDMTSGGAQPQRLDTLYWPWDILE
ncbi:IMPACT family member yigZ [uncultured Clostridium sp.]|nr:IMPACT family member yigZ [uncultured Clostridium sp.]